MNYRIKDPIGSAGFSIRSVEIVNIPADAVLRLYRGTDVPHTLGENFVTVPLQPDASGISSDTRC